MKKLLTITLFLLLVLPTNAQINRNIWGFTLGKTTKTQVINFLNSKGYKYETSRGFLYEASNYIDIIELNTTNYISFGGAFWNKVEIYIIDDILYDMRFIRNNENQFDAHKSFESLKYKLNQKYAAYKQDLGISATYDDNKTCIYIAICDSPDVGTFYLINYKYKPILKRRDTEGIDDL